MERLLNKLYKILASIYDAIPNILFGEVSDKVTRKMVMPIGIYMAVVLVTCIIIKIVA